MAQETGVKTSLLKAPEEGTIKDMIQVYQEAYKNDKSVQLKLTLPNLIEKWAKTIALRLTQPECEFIVARTKSTNQIVGWLALAFKLEVHKRISEEHVLYTQYALLPDIVSKANDAGIDTVEMKSMAHHLFRDFKEARERQLPDKHCIISTLVVDPEHQNTGVASALLSKAISRSEAFSFPMWVPAPEAYRSLFEKHDFEEAGEYHLDLNEYVPMLDHKGKATAAPNLDRYAWKFMMRKEPLEKAIRAYESSKVFAEEEAERRVEGRRLGKVKEQKTIPKASGKDKATPRSADLLLGGDIQTASGKGLVARDDAEAGPSTPLLTKSKSKDK